MRVEELIFRPLIGIDRERRFVPSLALSWAASSDGLVYDIRLDPKARWEDGSPVTSNDVAFTIDRVRDPKVPAANWRWGFEDVASVETPDALTAIVRFRRPYAQTTVRLHPSGRLRGGVRPSLRGRPQARRERALPAGELGAEPDADAAAAGGRPGLRVSVREGRLPHHPRQRRALPGGDRRRAGRVPRHPGPGGRRRSGRRSSSRRTACSRCRSSRWC